MNYNHLTPKSFEDQVALLKSRGMLFDNEKRAEKYLAYIGYQRLSVYWNVFYQNVQTKEHFIKGIKFEDILNLYIFDRKLRGLFLEASERIEICMKVLLSDSICIPSSDPFWYLNSSYFNVRTDKFFINGEKQKELCDHNWVLEKINDNLKKFSKNNSSLKRFADVRQTPIPSWELVDILTFGLFSNVMSLVKGENSLGVYQQFDLPKKILDNWLECVVGVRNICAHYGLLYRRSFSNTPMSLSKSKKRTSTIDLEPYKMTFYAQFFVYSYLLNKISPTSSWTSRVKSLISEHISNPLLSYDKMGFPADWDKNPLFNNA